MNTLGLVTIAAGGTPQALSSRSIGAVTVTLTPKPGNAAIVYYGTHGMVVASGVNVAGAIPKPANATTGPFTPATLPPTTGVGGYRLENIYIDGTTGDGVYVEYV